MGSAETDKVAMLAFKGRGDEFGDLITWSSATAPCGDGSDSYYAGWNSQSGAWVGVTCCADGSWGSRTNGQRCSNAGRVTHIGLDDKPGLRGTLEDLKPLTALIHLSLYLSSAVSGDVASLKDMARLTRLSLAGSNVFGNAMVIRNNIPTLANWGEGAHDYTPCSLHRTCPRSTQQTMWLWLADYRRLSGQAALKMLRRTLGETTALAADTSHRPQTQPLPAALLPVRTTPPGDSVCLACPRALSCT
jgi:hypothetical protein